MTLLLILFCVLVGLAFLFLIPSLVMMQKMQSISKPLTDDDVVICAKIVSGHKGYPYVCRWALKHKACPCLPCKKLEEAKV